MKEHETTFMSVSHWPPSANSRRRHSVVLSTILLRCTGSSCSSSSSSDGVELLVSSAVTVYRSPVAVLIHDSPVQGSRSQVLGASRRPARPGPPAATVTSQASALTSSRRPESRSLQQQQPSSPFSVGLTNVSGDACHWGLYHDSHSNENVKN